MYIDDATRAKHENARARLHARRMTCRYCGKKFANETAAAAHITRLCQEDTQVRDTLGVGVTQSTIAMKHTLAKFLPPVVTAAKVRPNRDTDTASGLVAYLTGGSFPLDYDFDTTDVITMRKLLKWIKGCPSWFVQLGKTPSDQLAHVLKDPNAVLNRIKQHKRSISVISSDTTTPQRTIQNYLESQLRHPGGVLSVTETSARLLSRGSRVFSPEIIRNAREQIRPSGMPTINQTTTGLKILGTIQREK